ncbi:hypothetical protein PHMEG_00019859 [Phytophthora megakarya]|uniref:Uncharacterized protein n=1 Tax=Phytophthora megakarya TaxID=4795 RepID=A0A225VQ94_9STRA|nr:hypothetical protein PHMEG_00019859 [Phytophthora megakarya]
MSMKRSRTKNCPIVPRQMAPTSSCRQWLASFSRFGITVLARSSPM